jgi:CsoR family transcriptional regulator, copper-sensing transcriptional repressor
LPSSEEVAVRGYTLNKEDYQRRLRRIEGQVRGLQRMIEEDAYCIDVLTQSSAVTQALQKVALGLLDEHIRHCVAQAARDEADAEALISEATSAIARLIRA